LGRWRCLWRLGRRAFGDWSDSDRLRRLDRRLGGDGRWLRALDGFGSGGGWLDRLRFGEGGRLGSGRGVCGGLGRFVLGFAIGFVSGFAGWGKEFGLFRLSAGNGFVRQIFRQLTTEGFQAVEFLDGATIVALGLGLVAEQSAVEFGVHAAEGLAEVIVADVGVGRGAPGFRIVE
jgi:hypothetical protein